MRFDLGYVRVYRKIMNSDLYQKGATYLGLWLSLLVHASRYPINVPHGNTSKKYPPGSLVIGLELYARELKLSTSELRTRLRYLANTDRISIDSSNTGTVITIRNWAVFQNDESAKEKPIAGEQQLIEESSSNSSLFSQGSFINEDQPIGELKKTRSKEEVVLPSSTAGDDKAKETRSEVWNSYAAEFKTRYGIEPVRNAKFNALAKQLVQRIGTEAPFVAAYYVHHNKPFYVDKGHQLEYCVKDCEGLLLELKGCKASVGPTKRERPRTAFERNTNWDQVMGIEPSVKEAKNE